MLARLASVADMFLMGIHLAESHGTALNEYVW